MTLPGNLPTIVAVEPPARMRSLLIMAALTHSAQPETEASVALGGI